MSHTEGSTHEERLYSPRQIFWSTFFGGPFALLYMLVRNFDGLGRFDEARRFKWGGLAAALLLLVVVLFIPGKFSVPLFIGLAAAGQHLAREYHFGGAKVPPEGAPLHSTGRAIAACMLSFLAWVVVVVIVGVTLMSLGVKIPE